ncbi:CDP-diglyceride synthetase [Desulfocapsa sulfexigens DSM 10523]|uniref:Phosphatidate cytidylyltransferase n=1 Tax=Desulfocapsa sulfexigens (strain DSM 10523 / SB164P1) TaxID=1167006 RepID=M1NCG5_DESSD|nr:phosphatidate cytidylyltransferase [Desulfocapsa sulfexigens]AGF77449.1 CDP-diglyceride synthetase [Desulfocapsa sulfexigens DSM 10523]
MGRQDIAIGALELWLLLPALGVPFGVWQYRKGCPDFIVNLLVWIILIPLVVVFSSLGLSAFTALVAVACICGCLELAGLDPADGKYGNKILVALACSLPIPLLAFWFSPDFPWLPILLALSVPFWALLLPRFKGRGIPVWTMALSIGAGLAFWIGIHSFNYGTDTNYVLWAFSVVAVNDILAAVLGKMIRSPHPFPTLSPNKSVVGYLGGMGSGVVAGFLISFALPHFGTSQIFTASLLLAVAGSAGDLFASWIKRRNNVKDFSRVLMTMGGVLDRLDSLLAAGCVFYFYITFTGLS